MQDLAILATLLLAGLVQGQSSPATQTTQDLTASITSAVGAAYTNPLIKSLWSDAVSLISSNYPSTTVTNVAALTWPSVVVLGSATYTITPGVNTLSTTASPTPATVSPTLDASSTPNQAASNATAANNQDNNTSHTDKRLGIALGVGIGGVALGVLIFLIWLLHRRKKRTGTYARHRRPSISDDEIQAWKAPSSHTSIQQFPEKYMAMDAPHPPMPPMRTHPALARGVTDDNIRPVEYSSDESNPFHTPYETYAELAAGQSREHSLHELHGESSMGMLSDRRPPSLITSAALSAVRPSTPYMPQMMRQSTGPVSPVSPAEDVQHRGFWRSPQDYVNLSHQDPSEQYGLEGRSLHHQTSSSNPFLSDEDDMLDTPPHIPTRSPNRQSSPTVHYPSGDELSTFDFGLAESRRRWAAEDGFDGGDGWTEYRQKARRYSSIGRHELA